MSLAKEIISRQFGMNNTFRIRVVKENKDLVAIHNEANYGDCYGWEQCEKVKRIRREEIEAAAKLLNIVKGD